jgi:aspartate/methionine/tyrosine aminotransferase
MDTSRSPSFSRRLRMTAGLAAGCAWASEQAMGKKDLIWMSISDPEFAPRPHIIEAVKEALDQGLTHYGPFRGLLEAREAVADKLEQESGVRYDPATEILMSSGCAMAEYIACQAILDPGDEVIVTDPTYMGFAPYIMLAGGTPVWVRLVEEDGWVLDLDELRAKVGPKTKALMLNSPNNPTGTVFTREELEQVAEVACRNNLIVMYDMLFDKMVFDGIRFENVVSIPGMKERTILLGGFSKVYAMCGFRVGWLAGDAELVRVLAWSLHDYLGGCSPVFQKGAVAALRGPQNWLKEWIARCQRRRDWTVDGLNGIPGIHCQLPQAGYWAFPNVSDIEKDSYKLAARLINEAGVVTSPGRDHGPRGESHLRVVYAMCSDEQVRESIERIRNTLIR